MKKLLAIFMLLTLTVALFAGCGKESTETGMENGGNEGSEDGKKYALMMSHMTNAFTMEMAGSVEAKAEELGVDVTVFDGEQDVANQISQIESAIIQGYAGIMVEPVSVDGIKPALAAANKAGIPIITVNQRATDQDLANSYVGANPIEGGEMEMKAAVEAIGGEGNVAFLLGPLGSDAQIGRTQGYS